METHMDNGRISVYTRRMFIMFRIIPVLLIFAFGIVGAEEIALMNSSFSDGLKLRTKPVGYIRKQYFNIKL